ncbi:ferrochelatase [Paraliomyxa miuraensis]|uniref:ferrochelatase n=1 Tax=Paraliomyxa miuraensis TaxID=376150 RepID=UPI002251161A|nr:ferrochelatase [Paraliomyxa miuraensis]MCX4243516.1 ferrochelatase [Paraliomyxa miuraensis]
MSVPASSPSCAGALQRLADADARRSGARWLSLSPERSHAHTLEAIGRELWSGGADPRAAEALADGLATIEAAMRRSFPRNVFGDLDLLAGSLWRGALAAGEGAVAHLRAQCMRVAALQELFGEATAIRFRYVHDFVYGFDWAKWVARDPANRAHVGPFSPEFLATMEHRGHELLVLIDGGHDPKYPPLPDERPRNPFGFSREPDAEIALHRQLAHRRLIPVEAWCVRGRARWDLPFAQLRREHAARLGLADGDPAGLAPLRGV